MKTTVILYDPEKQSLDKFSYAQEVLRGLKQQKKSLPMKFLYDEQGSKLCTSISQAESYYVWKSDKQVLEIEGKNMLKLMGDQKFNLIDLGAGDASKTEVLLDQAQTSGYQLKYIPLDISAHSMMELRDKFSEKYPKMQMTFLTSQFQEGITWVQNNLEQKNVYLFSGSTFGNQTLDENKKFCRMLHSKLKGNDLFFIGIDLWKNPQVITRAYLDNGFQSQFLLNNLKRMNKQLGANFNLDKFYGFPYFEPHTHNMIGLIISGQKQSVNLCGQHINFKKGETIETMMSRKWVIEQLIELWEQMGFKSIQAFYDKKKYYAYIGFQKN